MKELFAAAVLICLPALAQAQTGDVGSSDGQGAAKFVAQFWSAWSRPNSVAMPYIQSAVADHIDFFGKSISRDAYMTIQQAFAKRWPERKYSVQPGSEDLICNEGASTCDVKGIVNWRDFSPERGSLSIGAANFSFSLRELTVDGMTLYLLTDESGSVISRNLSQASSDTAIGEIASPQPPTVLPAPQPTLSPSGAGADSCATWLAGWNSATPEGRTEWFGDDSWIEGYVNAKADSQMIASGNLVRFRAPYNVVDDDWFQNYCHRNPADSLYQAVKEFLVEEKPYS